MCGTLENSGLGWRSWTRADPLDCCWVSSDTVNRVQVSCPRLPPKVAPGKQRYGRSRWLLRPQAVSKLRVKVKWGPAYGAGTEDSRAGVPSRSELSEGADEPAHSKERRLESAWGGTWIRTSCCRNVRRLFSVWEPRNSGEPKPGACAVAEKWPQDGSTYQ